MKKFLAFMLALVMTLALAACGGDDGQKDGSASGANQGDAQTSGGTQPPADGAAVIKLGGVGPLTGDAAIYGSAAKGGAEIAVEEINGRPPVRSAL